MSKTPSSKIAGGRNMCSRIKYLRFGELQDGKRRVLNKDAPSTVNKSWSNTLNKLKSLNSPLFLIEILFNSPFLLKAMV
jgi:hypothetical protein